MSSYIRKIKAGRIGSLEVSANTYIGETGTIFYDEVLGDLRISDGHTPGGIVINTGTGGGSGVSVTNAEIIDGNLIVTLSDSTIINAGYVQGDTGPQGIQGATGPQGTQGNVGPQGPQGIQGNTGPKGDTGAQGIQGNTGPTGAQGIQGNTGPKGDTGAQGIQGNTGPAGAQGIQGNVGPQGPQGIQGIQGNTGAQGISVTLVGNVATSNLLPPTGNPGDGYIVTSSGNLYFWNTQITTWVDIGPIVGPEGPRGPQGIQGNTGPQGIQGIQGNTGPTGPQGVQGIQGNTGPAGAQGIQGNTGPQGPQGIQGNTGPTGAQGIQGIQGNTGPQGPQGIQGNTGPQGPQGIQGNTGPQGPQGEPGSAANTGNIVFTYSNISSGTNSTVYLKTNNQAWSFGTNGNLRLPSNMNFLASPAISGTGIIFGDGTYQYTAFQGPGPYLTNGGYNATLDPTGNLTVPGNILPAIDNTQDLGSADQRFRHLYVGPGTVYVGNAAIKTTASGNLILPGVTRAVPSSAYAEEVEDTGDQTYTFTTVPTVIDNARYQRLNGGQVSNFGPALYEVDGLDNDGYIDGITITNPGTGYADDVATLAEQDMWATEVVNPLNRFDANDWIQIPFRVRSRAGESEYEFSTSGGGNADLGNLTITDSNIVSERTGNFVNLGVNDNDWMRLGTYSAEKLQLITDYDGDYPRVWEFGANGTLIIPNGNATISNNGEFRLWSDTDITVYKNGQDGYAVKAGRIENWINNGLKSVIDSTGVTVASGAFKGNLLNFGQNNSTLAGPASNGSSDRIRLWDFRGTNPTGYNYAIGAEGNHVWFAMDVDSDTGGFKFYSQANLAAKIGGHGTITLGEQSSGIFWSNGAPYSTGGGGSGFSLTTDNEAPSEPNQGDLWYNTNEGRTYVRWLDTWIDASPTVAPPPSYYFGDSLEINNIEESGNKLVIAQDANSEQPGILDGTQIDYIPTATLEANDWIGSGTNDPATYATVTFANGETRLISGWNTDSYGTSGFLVLDTNITIIGEDAWPITVTSYDYVYPQAVLNFGDNTLTVDRAGNLLVNGNLVTGSGSGTPTDVYDPNGDVTIQTQGATWTFNACNTLSWPSNSLTVSTYGGNSSFGSSGGTTFTTYTGFTFNANSGMGQWQMDVHGNLILPTGGFINYANGQNILSGITSGGANTGDITFSGSDITGAGNEVILTANTTNWTFSANGNLELPNGSSIDAGTEGYGIGLTTDRGTVLFGNSPELGQLNHYHIMKLDPGAVDLFFGDDTDYLHLPPSGGVGIGASGYSWTFGRDGVLALPGANAAIGAIETVDSIDLYGNSGAQYVQLNWDNQNFVYVDSTGAHMQAGPTAPGEYEIFLSTNGSTTFPDHMPVSITGNLTVGNLTVNGTSTIVNTTSYSVTDNIVQFAVDNPADTLDIGFVGHCTVNSTLQHTGLVRDASTGLWKLFSNVTAQPGTTVDFSNAIFDDLQLDKLYADTIHLTGTAPSGPTGASGDLAGDIHVDANYLYYCIADWVNTSGPWTTTLTADKNPSDVFKIQIAKSSVYGTPTGDTFNNQGTAWLVSLNGVSTYVDLPAIDAGTDWILDLNSTPSVFGTGDVVVLTNPVSSQATIWKSIPLNVFQTAVTGTYSNANVASYLVANPQSGTYSNANVAAYLTNQNITSANIGAFQTYANATFSTGGGSNYSNANVVANLQNFVTSISTTANITTTANIIAPNYLFANGVNILSTVSGGAGSYANTDVAAYLAANSALYLGNPVTRYPNQANVTQTFIGNTTTIGAGSNQLGGTYILNNAYFGANGAMYARNTQTGAAQFSISGGSFSWAGTTGAVTANSYQAFGLWASLSSTGLSTSNSIGITSAGALTAAAGLILNSNASIVSNQSTASIFNTTATTINFGGAATTITAGSATANLVVGTSSGAGNVFARNFNGTLYGNTVGTTATYTGTITAANVSITSNITVANIVTSGTYGNITGANVVSANTFIASSATAFYAPNRPAFRVYGNTSTAYVAGTTISTQPIDYNQGSYYNNSTGLFTAPVPGLYHAYATIRVGTNNGLNQVGIQKNSSNTGANVIAFWETDTNTGTATHFSITGYAKLVAGDTIRLQVITGNVNFDSNDSWGVTYIG